VTVFFVGRKTSLVITSSDWLSGTKSLGVADTKVSSLEKGSGMARAGTETAETEPNLACSGKCTGKRGSFAGGDGTSQS
jgi:hypothetical protein